MMIFRFVGIYHFDCLVKMRIEWFASRRDRSQSQFHERILQLFVDEFDSAAKFRFISRRWSAERARSCRAWVKVPSPHRQEHIRGIPAVRGGRACARFRTPPAAAPVGPRALSRSAFSLSNSPLAILPRIAGSSRHRLRVVPVSSAAGNSCSASSIRRVDLQIFRFFLP